MTRAAAGLASWALFATPASALPVRAGDARLAGIADGAPAMKHSADRRRNTPDADNQHAETAAATPRPFHRSLPDPEFFRGK